jgi:hypothetical protein
MNSVATQQEGTMRNSSAELSYQPSQLSEPPGKPGAEHKRLEVFLGKWKAQGTAAPGSPSPGRMRTEDSYEWFPGNFFLVNRGHLQVNDDPAAPHIWIFGYDAPNDSYFIHAFDSLGDFRVYRLTVHDRTWTYVGDWERAILTFSEDGQGYSAHWEHTKDGSSWQTLCDVKAIKIA